LGSCPKGYIQLPEYIDIHFTPLYIGGEVRISYSGRVDTPLAGNPKNQIKGTQKSQKAQKKPGHNNRVKKRYGLNRFNGLSARLQQKEIC
jgi:hypothetical protein